MDRGRGPKLPNARATDLFARSVFRQLRQAGYTRPEIIGFVNELLDVVTKEADDAAPLSGVTDPETRLANSEVLTGALEFEMRRARDAGGAVLVLALDIELPQWISDEVVQSLHEGIARQLPRAVRPHDTVARVTQSQYVIVLPGASPAESERIVRRILASSTAARRAGDQMPDGAVIRYRTVLFDGATGRGADGSDETADGLLARMMAAPPSIHDLPTTTATSDGRKVPTTRPPPSRSNDVVLALGGGAARAAAHIGVLKALRVSGIEVAGVAGSSAGALVGAMFLLGMDDEAILDRFETFTRSPVYRRMRRLYATYRRAAMSPRAALAYFRQSGLAFLSNVELAAIDDETFAEFIEHFVGRDRDIAELGGRFAVAATDLRGSRGVVVKSGPLHLALRATCAVPGLFRPQHIDAWSLIDGAMVSEVPVHAARSLGLSAPVVAVYLARPEHAVETFGSSAEVQTRTTAIIHKELVREQLRYAPHLITALVEDISWLDFRKARQTAEIGFMAGLAYASGSAIRT